MPAIGGRLQIVIEKHSMASTPVAITEVHAEKSISCDVVALILFINQPTMCKPGTKAAATTHQFKL